MALSAPDLDDRRFQDIVDQVKLLIPQYCPEWTDHNVSDPGVAMIELFAWMTDMLLYRVNQVPDKMYIKFLDLIGVHLAPPRAARAPITFYLSAPQPVDVVIPTETEVATVRTETSTAITFSTEADLTLRPAVVTSAYTRRTGFRGSEGWTSHDLWELGLPGKRIALFPQKPAPGDGFYVALERDHSQHVLALVLGCESAGGAGVNPRNPPLEWQIWRGGASPWVRCEVEYDGTGGFNYSGEIILHLPGMTVREAVNDGGFQLPRSYWLRCVITEPQGDQGAYRVSPEVERMQVESRGGTVEARQATSVYDELLGVSDGNPGQSFSLLHRPILALDSQKDYLTVETPAGDAERWEEVADFADSNEGDRHFCLDTLSGAITLGPSLLQPDGSVYRFGAVPPKGSVLRFHRYQYGGGVAGNLPKGTLRVLKTAVPYVTQVINRQPALGGQNAQTLDDAKLRAPQSLRTRNRAVTADDYEFLAAQVPGVARALCFAPGAQPGDATEPQPGQVFVVVLPQVDAVEGRIPPERLTPSADVHVEVMSTLDRRRVLGVFVDVRHPQYVWVNVDATIRVRPGHHVALRTDVQRQATQALYRYLNPFVGGPYGTGWPFGRDVHLSELYGVLQQIPAVEFVENVRMSISDPDGGIEPTDAGARLTVARDAIVCSNQHQVVVS